MNNLLWTRGHETKHINELAKGTSFHAGSDLRCWSWIKFIVFVERPHQWILSWTFGSVLNSGLGTPHCNQTNDSHTITSAKIVQLSEDAQLEIVVHITVPSRRSLKKTLLFNTPFLEAQIPFREVSQMPSKSLKKSVERMCKLLETSCRSNEADEARAECIQISPCHRRDDLRVRRSHWGNCTATYRWKKCIWIQRWTALQRSNLSELFSQSNARHTV